MQKGYVSQCLLVNEGKYLDLICWAATQDKNNAFLGMYKSDAPANFMMLIDLKYITTWGFNSTILGIYTSYIRH